MITKFNSFINEANFGFSKKTPKEEENDDSSSYMNAQRMLVINKILDGGKFTKLDKSLMTKLTGEYSIGMLSDSEKEHYYFLLRGKKQSKSDQNYVYSG